jgi:hypothetical protein
MALARILTLRRLDKAGFDEAGRGNRKGKGYGKKSNAADCPMELLRANGGNLGAGNRLDDLESISKSERRLRAMSDSVQAVQPWEIVGGRVVNKTPIFSPHEHVL